MEAKKENKIEIIEESNEINQIEETINAMISKVMEEKDKSHSLDFDDDEIEDDSFKRLTKLAHSTRDEEIIDINENASSDVKP